MSSRVLLLLATLLPFGIGVALAHASLETSEPPAEGTVTEPLEQIRLVFNEAVELDFSLFAVLELDAAEVDLAAEDAWGRLAGLAGARVSAVLAGEDDEGLIDAGPAGDARRSDEVTLELPDDLAPGLYVVMWRALSVDTHATQDFFVFEYAPGAQP